MTSFIFDLIAKLMELELCCYSECYNWNDEQMWRDILLVVGFVLTLIMFFDLIYRRLSRYTRPVRTEATRVAPSQRWKLSFAITLSIAYIPMIAAYIFIVAGGFVEFSLAMALRLIAGAGAIWFYTIAEILGLREKWGGKAILVAGLSFIALFIAGYALSDMTVLEKIAYPAATIGIACVVVAVKLHISRKSEDERSPISDNK